LCALAAAPALAQKSTEDGLRDCEKLAAVKFKAEIWRSKKFTITRADVEEDKFADKVGSQFVSTVYHGNAVLQELRRSPRRPLHLPARRARQGRGVRLHAAALIGGGNVIVLDCSTARTSRKRKHRRCAIRKTTRPADRRAQHPWAMPHIGQIGAGWSSSLRPIDIR